MEFREIYPIENALEPMVGRMLHVIYIFWGLCA